MGSGFRLMGSRLWWQLRCKIYICGGAATTISDFSFLLRSDFCQAGICAPTLASFYLTASKKGPGFNSLRQVAITRKSFLGKVLPVIMPQMKPASSLAIAVTATLRFLPLRIM